MDKDLLAAGLAARAEVLGKEYVERSYKNADDFNRPFQEIVSEYCWGAVWTDDTLPRKTRSMLNLVMLTALNRSTELKLHIRGALNNGCTREEIRAVLIQAAIYCGIPAGVEAFRCAREVFAELDKKPG